MYLVNEFYKKTSLKETNKHPMKDTNRISEHNTVENTCSVIMNINIAWHSTIVNENKSVLYDFTGDDLT